ncbi:MAG: amidohydrolase, partial [Firmicutes bacterium]|nr:amidohydrolase [Bacillota bacterium]
NSLIRFPLMRDLIKKLTFVLLPTVAYTDEWIEILSKSMIIDDVNNKGSGNRQQSAGSLDLEEVESVSKVFKNEMEEAGIILATPLMMELDESIYGSMPAIPYKYQIEEIMKAALEYPFEIMPFIGFNPRKPDSFKQVIDCLENKGFLGVKMYPALGFNPDPNSLDNNRITNTNLRRFYKYASENNIPITAHCARAGAYSGSLIGKKGVLDQFSHPDNWAKVLQNFPNLRLNLAHFGGSSNFMEYEDGKSLQDNWTGKIVDLIRNYDNVYTDTSAYAGCLSEKDGHDHFRDLLEIGFAKNNSCDISNRVMFGTDWPMNRNEWEEKDFVYYFNQWYEEEKANRPPIAEIIRRFAWKNAICFLFPEQQIPHRLNNFYKNIQPKKNVNKSNELQKRIYIAFNFSKIMQVTLQSSFLATGLSLQLIPPEFLLPKQKY